MTFEQLMRDRHWKPIRNCPGRFVLDEARQDLRPQDLLGDGVEVAEHSSNAAQDAVLVCALEGGGLISYRREDGSYLHTLNNAEGFHRKLSQLGINLPEQTRPR